MDSSVEIAEDVVDARSCVDTELAEDVVDSLPEHGHPGEYVEG